MKVTQAPRAFIDLRRIYSRDPTRGQCRFREQRAQN